MSMLDKKIMYRLPWIFPIALSLTLFLGYFFAELNHEENVKQYLKGLTIVNHFGIHFVTGVFFGLLFIIVYYYP